MSVHTFALYRPETGLEPVVRRAAGMRDAAVQIMRIVVEDIAMDVDEKYRIEVVDREVPNWPSVRAAECKAVNFFGTAAEALVVFSRIARRP